METDWKELALNLAFALRKLAYAARYRYNVNKALAGAENALGGFQEHWNAAQAKEETDG